MDLVIRAAVPEDYEGACALFAQLDQVHVQGLPEVFQSHEGPVRPEHFFAQLGTDERIALFVAEHQNTLIGLAHCTIRDAHTLPLFVPRHVVSLDDFVVSAAFQHQGVGCMLMERIQQWAYEKGLKEIELTVWEFNTSARAFYEKLGYETVKRVMKKRLS